MRENSQVRQQVGDGSPLLLWVRPLLIIGMAVLICAQFVDWRQVFVSGLHSTLNDQVGYVTGGRNWAATGRLETTEILPSVLAQHTTRNTLYMPGHYWMLGLTFRALGFSVAHAFIPEMIGFIAAGIVVYCTAFKLFGARVAYLSCALFTFFPLNLIYTFTAMMEMEVVAAALLAFLVFLSLPNRLRPWLGPLTLIIPVLFRETGITVAAVMLALVLCRSRFEWKKAFVFCMFSAFILVLVMKSPLGSGRPSVWGASVLGRGSHEVIYQDAFAVAKLQPHTKDWIIGIARKTTGNLHELLVPGLKSGAPTSLDALSMLFVLSGIPLGAYLWRRDRTAFALGVCMMIALLLLLELSVYKIWGFYGTRVMLMCQPFVALLWAVVLDRWLNSRHASRITVELLIVLIAMVGIGAMHSEFKDIAAINAQASADTEFLESLSVGDHGLLVSPYWISMEYLERHYPIYWSHLPSNLATLELLQQKYGVTTLILPVSGPVLIPERLRVSDVLQIGLTEEREASYRGIRYKVFKRVGTRRGSIDCQVAVAQ
jgi:hypothetical protein